MTASSFDNFASMRWVPDIVNTMLNNANPESRVVLLHSDPVNDYGLRNGYTQEFLALFGDNIDKVYIGYVQAMSNLNPEPEKHLA
jgi:hypothetical protein